MPEEHRQVVDNAIPRNAFFAMPENILINMIADDRPDIRSNALEKILNARKKNQGREELIITKLPSINFEASEYFEMIDWSTSYVSPVLRTFTNDQLIDRLSTNVIFEDWNYYKLPCHTVAVERQVKLTTEASLMVCGHENRDGRIRATLKSREKMKHFNTKNQYVL